MGLEMYARDVDETAARLRELRLVEWEDLGLAALAFGVALLATELSPHFALPIFLGGVTVGALGVRALWRRWDLVDGLAGEPDAYAIPEVFAYACRDATSERRRSFAETIRGVTQARGHPNVVRIAAVAAELEQLAVELEDDGLELDPASAVACSRLLTRPESVLFAEDVSVEELQAHIRHIRTGFTARPLAA